MDYTGLEGNYRDAIVKQLELQLSSVSHTTLSETMGHLLGRGKVFRPLLALGCCITEGCQTPEALIPLVTPLEMIHTFTLIHDDLPCMDDADLRRGVPAVHVKFGEAQAVLGGDALLNFALYCIADGPGIVKPATRLELLKEAMEATHQVVEGQMLDIELEGMDCTLEQLQELHHKKTGALLAACCATGAILAGADPGRIAAYREFGRRLGLLFQIRDDLLSVESTDEQMGKTLGTDLAHNKSTYPRVLGLERSHQLLDGELDQLVKLAQALSGNGSELLVDIVGFVARRSV